jgi:hypothetical protein
MEVFRTRRYVFDLCMYVRIPRHIIYLIRCIIHMHALSRQFVYEPLQIRLDVRTYLFSNILYKRIYCIF